VEVAADGRANLPSTRFAQDFAPIIVVAGRSREESFLLILCKFHSRANRLRWCFSPQALRSVCSWPRHVQLRLQVYSQRRAKPILGCFGQQWGELLSILSRTRVLFQLALCVIFSPDSLPERKTGCSTVFRVAYRRGLIIRRAWLDLVLPFQNIVKATTHSIGDITYSTFLRVVSSWACA